MNKTKNYIHVVAKRIARTYVIRTLQVIIILDKQHSLFCSENHHCHLLVFDAIFWLQNQFWHMISLHKDVRGKKTGSLKYVPTFSRVCPCALFTAIVKHSLTENWVLVNWTGCFSWFEGWSGIWCKKITSPLWSPTAICAHIICFLKFSQIRWVPLHCPCEGSMFLKRIIRQFFLA